MVRLALAAVVTLATAELAWGQFPYFPPAGRFGFFSGPGGVSVNIDSPYGGFSYSGSFPVPRAYDPYVYGRSYYGYVEPYGTYYNPQSGYVDHYLPPIYYPGELMYGPQAVRRFFGLDRAAPVLPPVGVAPPVGAAPAGPRASNLAARERASHFVAAGDQLFREQKQHEALQRYKSAAQAAPDVADAYFRQGFALIATNRYALAAEAFRRGLSLAPDWPSSDFRLDHLYGDAALARQAHQDALANAALHDPENADLMFTLGVFLHFDGQQERARKFFARAKELNAATAPYVEGFLAAAPAL